MPLSVTGMVVGELAEGNRAGHNKKAVLQLVKGTIPPHRSDIEALQSDNKSWTVFLIKLAGLRVFVHLLC